MIAKSGKDCKLVGSYRSISLILNLSNVVEAVILSRVSEAISERNFLSDE